jgi:hypothetical protein
MKFIGPDESEPIADMGCFIINPRAMLNVFKKKTSEI